MKPDPCPTCGATWGDRLSADLMRAAHRLDIDRPWTYDGVAGGGDCDGGQAGEAVPGDRGEEDGA